MVLPNKVMQTAGRLRRPLLIAGVGPFEGTYVRR